MESWDNSRRLSWILNQESLPLDEILQKQPSACPTSRSWDDVLAKLDEPSSPTSTSSMESSSRESTPTGHRPPPPKPVEKHDQFPLREAQHQLRRSMSADELDGSPGTCSLPASSSCSVSQSATYPSARLTPREFFQGQQQQPSDDELSKSLPAIRRDDSQDCVGWESRDGAVGPPLSPSLAKIRLVGCRTAGDEEEDAALLATADRRMPRVMAELRRATERARARSSRAACPGSPLPRRPVREASPSAATSCATGCRPRSWWRSWPSGSCGSATCSARRSRWPSTSPSSAATARRASWSSTCSRTPRASRTRTGPCGRGCTSGAACSTPSARRASRRAGSRASAQATTRTRRGSSWAARAARRRA